MTNKILSNVIDPEVLWKAKKTLSPCISSFSNYFLNSKDMSELHPKFITLCKNSNLENEQIRPIAWKIFLKVLPSSQNSSLQNNKMKIYESIFLGGGPYLDKYDFIKEDARKNKAQWINKKGFIPYIGKETILKNSHMIENYLSLEPASPNNVYNFRQIQKSKWVGKDNFYA